MRRPYILSLACLIALGACSGGDDALAGRIYLRKVPLEELIGSWRPRSHPPSLLQSLLGRRATPTGPLVIRAGGECELTRELAQLLLDCGYHSEVQAGGNAPCAWRIEGSPEGEGVSVVFRGPDNRSRAARFGVFRHSTNGDLAFLGTCGSGDAFGLFRQP
jgi:hypothetical protein